MKKCMDSDNLHRRLKKIIGQVQAIDRMIDEDVPCEDILSQLNAAKSALNKCGQVVLEGHSFKAQGYAGLKVGSLGLLSLFISVIGTIIGLLSFKEDDKFYTLSKVGSMLCGILAVFMIAVFLMGL